jgi:hypothetical protein
MRFADERNLVAAGGGRAVPPTADRRPEPLFTCGFGV